MRYYIDEKISIWRRNYFDTDDIEKLTEEVKNANTAADIDFDEYGFEASELLYDTEALLYKTDNDGSRTLELFNEEHELIAMNCKV